MPPTDLEPAVLRVSGPADVVDLVPYLLGFHPEESAVLLIVDQSMVSLTARFDLALCDDPRQLGERLDPLLLSREQPQCLILGYATDPERAEAALGELELVLSPDRVIDSIVVSQGRYWSRRSGFPTEPSEGRLDPASVSPLRAAAVLAGLAVLPSRAELRQAVAAPRGSALAAAEAAWCQAGRLWSEADRPARHARVLELVRRGVHEAAGLDAVELAELGLLIDDVAVRDRAWLMMTHAEAASHLELWQAVVRAVPRQHAVPALCLMGMAAWLSGNGALQVICLEEGLSLRPGYSMLRLLEDINLTAAPPSTWDHMTGLAG